MYINSDTIFSMTQANQNFSQVARTVDRNGEAVVFKNNKPKYLVVDIENSDYLFDLTDDEKIAACRLVTEGGADYIKTSTGFSTGGATFTDIELFAEHVGPNVKIKASGGISSLEDARRFLSLGAGRLGTSRIVKIVKENEKMGN